MWPVKSGPSWVVSRFGIDAMRDNLNSDWVERSLRGHLSPTWGWVRVNNANIIGSPKPTIGYPQITQILNRAYPW